MEVLLCIITRPSFLPVQLVDLDVHTKDIFEDYEKFSNSTKTKLLIAHENINFRESKCQSNHKS